jgi:hypothetical protein
VRVSGWGYYKTALDTNPTPPSNASVTMAVHGFSVSRDNALSSFIPQYTKRLYWTGNPVFPVQQTDKGPAYMVGVIWKGDHRKWNSVLGASTGFASGLFFPDDEYVALRSGHAFAQYLNSLQGSGNTVSVVAHSLGNLFVNSAIREANTNAVSTYVMNEGAVTAEAFATSFSQVDPSLDYPLTDAYVTPYLVTRRLQFLNAHVAQMGYSADPNQIDAIWTQQLNDVLALPDTQEIFDQQYGVVTPGTETQGQQNDYSYRWRARPADTAGLTASPWLGYFAGNLTKTNLYNSFSNGDCALNQAFALNQIMQKPDRAAIDSFTALDYAFLSLLVPGANSFPASNRIDNFNNQLWIKQAKPTTTLDTISRLAYWYPARAGAVGSFGFTSVFQDKSIDFTDISLMQDPPPCTLLPLYVPITAPGPGVPLIDPGGIANLGLTLAGHLRTHGYMTGSTVPTVWPAYKKLLQTFHPSSQYPNLKDPDQ